MCVWPTCYNRMWLEARGNRLYLLWVKKGPWKLITIIITTIDTKRHWQWKQVVLGGVTDPDENMGSVMAFISTCWNHPLWMSLHVELQGLVFGCMLLAQQRTALPVLASLAPRNKLAGHRGISEHSPCSLPAAVWARADTHLVEGSCFPCPLPRAHGVCAWEPLIY